MKRKELFFSTFFLGDPPSLYLGTTILLHIGYSYTQNFFAINIFAFLYFHQSVHSFVLGVPTTHSALCLPFYLHTQKKTRKKKKKKSGFFIVIIKLNTKNTRERERERDAVAVVVARSGSKSDDTKEETEIPLGTTRRRRRRRERSDEEDL